METHTCATCAAGEAPYLERVRYFPGQLITAEDLAQEQNYQRARMRRHNRMLHGWGVVCGAWVRQEEPTEDRPRSPVLTVEPGYALGPYGDEIVIDRPVDVDVTSEDLDGNAVPCGGVSDPWCAKVRVDRDPQQPLYLAVKYAECPTRPVRANAGGCGCGCGGDDCEYSRVRDSFVIKVLTELPKSHDPMPGVTWLDDVLWCSNSERGCLPCPPDPWVVLATIDMASASTVRDVDCTLNRRYAAAFGSFYYMCGGGGGTDETERRTAMKAAMEPTAKAQPDNDEVAEPTEQVAKPPVKKTTKRTAKKTVKKTSG